MAPWWGGYHIYIICKCKCIPACVEKPGTICFTIHKGHNASNRQSANQFSCQGPQMASHLNYPSLAPLNGPLMPGKKTKEQNECCAVPPFLTKECYKSPCAVFLPQNVWGLPAINSNQEGQAKTRKQHHPIQVHQWSSDNIYRKPWSLYVFIINYYMSVHVLYFQ